MKLHLVSGWFTFIDTFRRKGNQEIMQNYIWWVWIHLLTPLEEKLSKKLYETTSGGSNLSRRKDNQKVYEWTSGGGVKYLYCPLTKKR